MFGKPLASCMPGGSSRNPRETRVRHGITAPSLYYLRCAALKSAYSHSSVTTEQLRCYAAYSLPTDSRIQSTLWSDYGVLIALLPTPSAWGGFV